MLSMYDKTYLGVGTILFIILYIIYYFMNINTLTVLDIIVNIVLFIGWFYGTILLSNYISYNN